MMVPNFFNNKLYYKKLILPLKEMPELKKRQFVVFSWVIEFPLIITEEPAPADNSKKKPMFSSKVQF